ncbi:hypothetical protein [uncultured Campylobacter sp.]|uniref:hypothetical protein n=1 Tax=uncultured Campylobacter sp. TaxID=218934 RepID=UPI0026344D58|nr:hypothetical protein [uncultured Campylobacter sp.]
MKKRDFNVLLAQKGEITLATKRVQSKKLYNRKKYKLTINSLTKEFDFKLNKNV